MKLRVVNWRCIDELEVELKPVTVLLGRNAAGKSSLAYAAYFLAKAAGGHPVDKLLERLYGAGADVVARVEDGSRRYPVVVAAEGAQVVLEGLGKWSTKGAPPWNDAFLLPSNRVAVLKMLSRLRSLGRGPVGHEEQAFAALAYALGSLALASMLESVATPSALLFIGDLMRLIAGMRYEERVEAELLGVVTISLSPLAYLIAVEHGDPYLPYLRLPAHLAPDGAVDAQLIKYIVGKLPQGSLLVIEEPEIHKNPLTVKDLIEHVAIKALESRSTVIMTTHDDIVVWTLVKLIEERKIRGEDVAVYYLQRGSGTPWTTAKELKIYEDGTIEELPDFDAVMRHLF